MDSFMQMNEHRGDEMDELVSQPAREVSEINISSPIQPGPFLIESQPGAAQLRDRMNAGQTVRAERYRSRTDLRPALIRGRGLAAKCTKAGSQKRMGKRRQNVSEYYGFESGLRGKQTLPRRISQRKFVKEEAERIKAEKLMQEFLRTEFSTKVMETDYVIANWDECQYKIRLIERVKVLESRVSRRAFAPVKQKLEAVEEYANVVEGAWLARHLEAVELDEDDKENAWRRLAYLTHSAWRFYVGVKRYQQIRKNEEASSNLHQQGVQRTRVEEKLSMLEAKLSIFTRDNASIIRRQMRSVDALSRVGLGDEIRPDKTDAKGKKEYKWVKERIFVFYENLKSELEKEIGTDEKDFISLERLVLQYVFTNRRPFEDRRNAEEKEAKALTALKDALDELLRNAENKCGKYAAILLGLLTEESSGYLEVPHDGLHVFREDTDIICRGVSCEYEERKAIPLFTHRPNIKDIVQGNLGDCYLLTGLISVVDQNPEEIMNIMRDNGDGTVTVCFRLEEPGENGGTVFTPCYVKVEKSIPVLRPGGRDAFSRGAFWVKMMEKAYAASGIHLLGKMNQYRKKHRQAPLKYSAFLKQMQDERRKLDYDEIKGGWPGQFVSLLLGKKSKFHFPGRYGRQRGGAAAEHGNAEQIQDGYYTPGEIQLYEGISESLKSGTYISFATKKLSQNRNGRNGEGVQAGVVGTHAYSIINTCRRRSGNMERRYVVVVNPWAYYGIFYRAGEGEIRKVVAYGEKEEGVFLMDIKTFAEVVGYWETVSA